MCWRRIYYHEILKLCRNCAELMGHDRNYKPNNMSHYWHEVKLQEYENFWNLEST